LTAVGCCADRKSIDGEDASPEVTWRFEVITHAQKRRCRLRTRVFNALPAHLRRKNVALPFHREQKSSTPLGTVSSSPWLWGGI